MIPRRRHRYADVAAIVARPRGSSSLYPPSPRWSVRGLQAPRCRAGRGQPSGLLFFDKEFFA